MSNYNTALQSNNVDLQAILDSINELPSAEDLEPVLQDKTVTPTTSQQSVSADANYDGLNTVIVNAIPSEYITTIDATASASDMLSGKTAYVNSEKITGTIATKTSSNLTANGATVTVPAGYYATQATKSVSTATQATPSISVNSSGLITASATQSAGYVSSGTKSATKQLTTQAAKTVTPSTSSQTAVASGVYTTGAVTVAAIPSTYVKPTATKTATTYTPTTTNQTIAAGTYCSGAQTIAGDANLVAENIAEGISIFGVTGTHSGGSSSDSSSGSVETCTVTITVSGGHVYAVLNCYEDNKITPYCYGYPFTGNNQEHTTTLTINNVICGTTIIVENNSYIIPAYSVDGSAENLFIYSYGTPTIWGFKAPTVANEICTIEMWDDD